MLGNWIGFNQRGGINYILPNRDGVNISSANNVVGGTQGAPATSSSTMRVTA